MEKSRKPKIRFKGFTDDWEQRKLIDICEYVDYRGKTPLKTDHGIFLVTAKNIKFGYIDYESSKEYILEEDYEEVMRRGKPEIGDVLITTEAPCGNIAQVNICDIALAQRIIKYRGRKNVIDNTYLKHYMLSSYFQMNLQEKISGGTVKGIKGSILHQQYISFPKFDEQIKIGQYFDDLDHLITLHQRKLEKLMNVKKSMLEKMFPKQGSKVPEIRFNGFTDDWEQRKLGEVVEFLDTMRKPLEGTKRIRGPYPYYGASGIVDYVDGYLFDEELILLSEDGANIMDRNYPVCFLASGKYWVNNHAHVLKVKQGNENSFVCNSLERKNYSYYNTGMAMPKLNKETCRNIIVTCPSFEEQKIIGDCFRNLEKLITLHQRKLEKLKNIKKSMLEKMFI